MLKLIFELDTKDEWPPVSAESLWFDKLSEGLQLRTIPFFVEGIAYDDVLDIEVIDDVSGIIRSVTISSGNSTVWAYFREGVDEQGILSKMSHLGIGSEGGALVGYYAINLPADRSLADLQSCMEKELANGTAELAFGVMRHRQ